MSDDLKRAVSRCRLFIENKLLCKLSGTPEESDGFLQSHCVFKISIHLTVHFINGINSGREVEEEFSDFFQAFLFLDIPTLGDGL